jgi:hypothetical protein
MYRMIDASGQLSVVNRPDGTPRYKLRRRKASWLVYGEWMEKVGTVRRNAPAPALDIEATSIDGVETFLVTRDNHAVQMVGAWRIEPADESWAIFDGKTEIQGYLQCIGPKTWTLRSVYSSEPKVVVSWNEDAGRYEARRGDEVFLYTGSEDLGAIGLIALTLEPLPVLSRVSLAMTLKMLDGIEPSKRPNALYPDYGPVLPRGEPGVESIKAAPQL